MSVMCIVQARMGSSRLPGKVLAEIVPGETVLERVVTRLRRAASVDHIVVASTVEIEDDAIAAACVEYDVACFRGSTFDVLDRFVQAAGTVPDADVIVRVTADCPFVDPALVDELVSELRQGSFDYVSNRLPPPHSRTFPVGLDVEVCTRESLETAWREATQAHQREHVTPFLYEQENAFRLKIVDLVRDLSHHRWTLDTPEDLAVVRALAEAVGSEPFGWEEILEATRKDPSIERANQGQSQKNVTDVDYRRE